MNKVIKALCCILTVAYANTVVGIELELGFENRYFLSEGIFNQERYHPSLRGELEYTVSTDDSQYEITLFGRYDLEDDRRTHVDARELHWIYIGNVWELKVGASKEFWGVTESSHLVDIINQSDSLENIDNEDKLGQPMVKWSIEKEWGTVDLFWLPFFRERRFNDTDGRFPQPLEVDFNSTIYESSAEEWHSDFAARYSHYIGDFEFAISHFSGTSREPLLAFNNDFTRPRLIPTYKVIDQTAVEIQYIWGDTLFKFEGITRSGFGNRFSALVAGLEYTQVGLLDTRYDLGWLLEYLFDDRQESATTPFERDIFIGWRLAFNDADSSEILAGGIWDPETTETFLSLEASKRLASNLKVEIEAQVFVGSDAPSSDLNEVLEQLSSTDGENKTAFLQDEDYLGFELVYFF